jgi:hypothetical protein
MEPPRLHDIIPNMTQPNHSKAGRYRRSKKAAHERHDEHMDTHRNAYECSHSKEGDQSENQSDPTEASEMNCNRVSSGDDSSHDQFHFQTVNRCQDNSSYADKALNDRRIYHDEAEDNYDDDDFEEDIEQQQQKQQHDTSVKHTSDDHETEEQLKEEYEQLLAKLHPNLTNHQNPYQSSAVSLEYYEPSHIEYDEDEETYDDEGVQFHQV